MKQSNEIKTVSALGKTWILDLDGTIVKHNGYKLDGKDSLLPGVEKLLSQIAPQDMVIFVTSRKSEYADLTEKFLEECHIRFDQIIYNAPYGERILINDRKPSGLSMSIGINTNRDEACNMVFEVDENL